MKHLPLSEKLNTVTHGIGFVLSVAGAVLLIVFASLKGSAMQIITAAVFGISLISMYLASTLYHLESREKQKLFFQRIDHLAIYLLIAGTYTPVCLVGLGGAWGWTIFGMIWGLAVLGFVFKLSPLRKNERISLSLYALMGWLIVIAANPLWNSLSAEALFFMISGGLAYTAGIYFFINDHKKYYHFIWHLFVLAGSLLHWFGIFFYII